MTPIIRTMLLVFTACFLCLPARTIVCKVQKQPAQHDWCAKGRIEGHWCAKGQMQHTGKNCTGACSDCCCRHITEYTALPVAVGLELLSRPDRTKEQGLYAEAYCFTKFQLIWTPPKATGPYL